MSREKARLTLTAADKLHYDFLETLTPFLCDIVTLANKPKRKILIRKFKVYVHGKYI